MTIARALSTITFPACAMLVASMNVCRCGNLGSTKEECVCTAAQTRLYRSRISGPLLDRIDIQIEVPPVKYSELVEKKEGENSETIRKRVVRARELQRVRYQRFKIYCNAQLSGRLLRQSCPIDGESSRLMERAVEKLGLSARAYDRILKVSRTIADLAGSQEIQSTHVAEAIQYRSLDRKPLS